MPWAQVRMQRWGGHNGDENPASLAIGELQDEENVYLRGETLGTRPGLEYDDDYTADFDPEGAVQCVVEGRNAFDTERNLVTIANGKFYVVADSNTPTELNTGTAALTITAGANNFWTAAQHKNALYFAGGTTGDVALMKWVIQPESTAAGSMNDPTAVTITGTTSRPLYIIQKWNRLWTSGYGGTDPDDNPMIGRYSALNNGDSWPEENTIGGASAVGGFSAYGDEYATGWASYTDNSGDWLFYLTNKRVYAVAQTGNIYAVAAKTDEIGAGCVSQRAWVDMGVDHGDAIFVSSKGVHSVRQSQQYGGRADRFLSWKIRDIWSTVNRSRLKYATAGYWPDVGIVLIAISTGSNTTNNLILCLDVKTHNEQGGEINADNARWYQWDLAGVDANVITAARDNVDNVYLYVGTTSGKVCRFASDVYSDLGTGYNARFVTKDEDHGLPGVTKGIGDVFMTVQPGGNYMPSLKVRFDYGARVSQAYPLKMTTTGTLWNQFIWNQANWATVHTSFRNKVYVVGSGETVGFEVSHNAAGQPFYIVPPSYFVDAHGEEIGQSEAA